MSVYRKLCIYLLFAVVGVAALLTLGSAKATDLNPAALKIADAGSDPMGG